MTIESAPFTGSAPSLDMGSVPALDTGPCPIDFEVIALQVAESTSSVRSKIASMEIECVASRSASLSDVQLARVGALKDAAQALVQAEEKLAEDKVAYSECTALYSAESAELEELKVKLAAQESEVSAKTTELENLIASLDASLMAKVLDEIRVSSREAAEVEEVHVSEPGEENERIKEERSAERLLAEFIDRMADEISSEISARRTSQI